MKRETEGERLDENLRLERIKIIESLLSHGVVESIYLSPDFWDEWHEELGRKAEIRNYQRFKTESFTGLFLYYGCRVNRQTIQEYSNGETNEQ